MALLSTALSQEGYQIAINLTLAGQRATLAPQLQGPRLLPVVHRTADERHGREPDRAVLPPQSGLRQWVLTFPFSWRRRLAQDGAMLRPAQPHRRRDGADVVRRPRGAGGWARREERRVRTLALAYGVQPVTPLRDVLEDEVDLGVVPADHNGELYALHAPSEKRVPWLPGWRASACWNPYPCSFRWRPNSCPGVRLSEGGSVMARRIARASKAPMRRPRERARRRHAGVVRRSLLRLREQLLETWPRC